jgi:hypothetical protein
VSQRRTQATRARQAEFVRPSGAWLDARRDFKARVVHDVDASFFEPFN